MTESHRTYTMEIAMNDLVRVQICQSRCDLTHLWQVLMNYVSRLE
jgi:hypothetical protein